MPQSSCAKPSQDNLSHRDKVSTEYASKLDMVPVTNGAIDYGRDNSSEGGPHAEVVDCRRDQLDACVVDGVQMSAFFPGGL